MPHRRTALSTLDYGIVNEVPEPPRLQRGATPARPPPRAMHDHPPARRPISSAAVKLDLALAERSELAGSRPSTGPDVRSSRARARAKPAKLVPSRFPAC